VTKYDFLVVVEAEDADEAKRRLEDRVAQDPHFVEWGLLDIHEDEDGT
jgi:hypothetical protein